MAALVAEASPDSGAALVVEDQGRQCATRIELDGNHAVLHPLGIEFVPVQLPARSEADLAELVLAERLKGSDSGEPVDGAQESAEASVDLGREVPDDESVDAISYVALELPLEPVSPPEALPELLVRVLGQPRVEGRPSLGARQTSLTAYLALKRLPVTIADIQDALWGGGEEVRPKTVWNLVSETRVGLGKLSSGEDALPPADPTLKTYRLAPCIVTDVEILSRAYAQHVHEPDAAAIEALDRALGLVEGRVFGTAGFEWAFRDGQHAAGASELVERAALRLAQAGMESGNLDLARRAIRHGLHGLPGNEALYRLRMQLEADVGNAAGVQKAYKELVHYLLDFDEHPSRETVELRKALRRRAAVQVPG
jgi:hypothetical protein